MTAPALHDLEARALWHLELGYEPPDLPPHAIHTEGEDFYDYDDDGGPDTCPQCAGTGGDPYNDYILPCEFCDGEGVRWWM